MRNIVVIVALGLLLTSCKSKGQWESLAGEHRADVEAFLTKLLGVRAATPSAPSDPSCWKLAPGESLRVWDKDGKPANTLRILDADLAAQLEREHDSIDYSLRTVRPQTDIELLRLVVWIRHPGRYEGDSSLFEAFKRVVGWYKGIRYVAVMIPDDVVDYSEKDPSLPARWNGRIALYDLQTSRWLGAVKLAMQGDRAKLFEYEWVDGHGRRVGPAGPDVRRDIQAARDRLNDLIDAAARYAIESGTSITDVSQLPKK